MSDPLLIALITAAATLLAPILSAYFSIRKDMSVQAGQTPPPVTVRRYWKEFALVGVGLVLAIAIVTVGRFANSEYLTWGYLELVRQGEAKNKAWVFPSIMVLVTMEKSPDGKSIDVDKRTFYMLQALQNVNGLGDKNSDKGSTLPPYQESYQSTLGVIHRIPGSEKEQPESDTSWNVNFDVTRGDRRSFITGAHLRMPMQLPSRSSQLFGTLGPNEDEFYWPNFVGNNPGDVIEDLLIVVQSQSLDISLPNYQEGQDDEKDAYRVLKNSRVPVVPIVSQVPSPQGNELEKHAHKTIVARFESLKDYETAGLRVKWSIPQGSQDQPQSEVPTRGH